MNLLDFKRPDSHDVTQAIREQANQMGLEVIVGELVGLVPLDAMISAGHYYSEMNRKR